MPESPHGEFIDREASDDHVVRLQGSVDVSRAAEWLAEAKRAAASVSDVTVRCEGLERLDASGLQILVALKRSVEQRGHRFRVLGLPAPVATLLRRVGAAELLEEATGGAP